MPTQVFLSKAAFADLERLDDFLADAGDPLRGGLLEFVLDALHVLTHQPGIGRPVMGRRAGRGLRELVIARRRTGYLAKYRYEPDRNLVLVLRIRHQKEAGYGAEPL